MKLEIGLTLGILSAALLWSGCVTHEETTYRDVERTRVEFENDAAGRIFYEALSRDKSKSVPKDSSTKVEIPVVFEHRTKVVIGESYRFNDAVARCDTNRDGKITESEARIYSEQVGRK